MRFAVRWIRFLAHVHPYVGVQIVYLGYIWILRNVNKNVFKNLIFLQNKNLLDLLFHAERNIKIFVIPPVPVMW